MSTCTLRDNADREHLRVLKQASGVGIKRQGFASLQSEKGVVERRHILQEATKPAVHSACCTHHVWRVHAVDIVPLQGHYSTRVFPCRPLCPKAIATCGHIPISAVTNLYVHPSA